MGEGQLHISDDQESKDDPILISNKIFSEILGYDYELSQAEISVDID